MTSTLPGVNISALRKSLYQPNNVFNALELPCLCVSATGDKNSLGTFFDAMTVIHEGVSLRSSVGVVFAISFLPAVRPAQLLEVKAARS